VEGEWPHPLTLGRLEVEGVEGHARQVVVVQTAALSGQTNLDVPTPGGLTLCDFNLGREGGGGSSSNSGQANGAKGVTQRPRTS
jgi:hypothetical protein